MTTLHLENQKAFRQWVSEWLPTLKPAQVVLLYGPMGVGKTQFVRWACEELGVESSSSPSFSIHNEYFRPEGVIDHLDLYRITDESDLESTGFWDLFEKPKGLIFVEWAERLGLARFSNRWSVVSVTLGFGNSETSRTLTLT